MELIAEQKYKQTEVGLIPEDWQVKSISQISNPVRGGSPRPAGDPRYFNGSFIPWLTVAALTNIPLSQIYVSETESSLTEEGSIYSRILLKGTLIIANSGATLGVAKLLSIKCCANDGIAALLEVNDKIDKLFLTYFINTKIKYLREVVATGNGQPILNTDLIGNIKVPLPPTKREQSAIATTLSDTDALITGLEKLIEKKRNIKQGAMQELLRSKEGWVEKTIEEIAEVKSGKRLPLGKTLVDEETKHPYIRVTDMTWGTVNTKGIKYVPEDVYPVIKNYRIFKDDIFISVAGTLGIVGKIPEALDGANLTENANKLTNIKCNRDFLLHYMMSPTIQDLIQSEQTLGAQPKLALIRIRNFKITLPSSTNEQEKIAGILSNMDSEIDALKQKLEKYREIKQGMMQVLLTGKIRLV